MANFKKTDLILIISILIISLTCLIIWIVSSYTYKGNLYANVYYHDECVYSHNIKEDDIFEIDGDNSHMIIEIKDSKVRVKESGCPEQICVNTGYIKRKTQTITCAPNDVYVKIGTKKKKV